MAKQRKIGAMIVLDGEKEFRSSVAGCNKALSTMKSEMRLVKAETAGNANSLETLKKKHEILSKALDTHAQKEEKVGKGLDHAKEDYARVGKELDEYRVKLARAETALGLMEAAGNASEESMESQKETVEELKKIVEKGADTYQKAENRVKDWEKQLNIAKAQTIDMTRALNENAAYMKEAENATDHCATSIDKFGNKTDETVEKLTSLSTAIKLKANEALIDLGKNAVQTAISGTLELQDANNKLAASTGATAEEMREYSGVMEELYKGNYGESLEDIADKMALVRQYTGEADPSRLKELTENAIALSDTFDMDFGESVRGIDSLMKNMGLTAEEAFDYIAVGAQNGLNKSGELADNITEYGQLWDQAGFSAEEMFTILQNGLDAGAYNLDKVNDFVKEFGISLSDGRIEENLGSFSEGTKNLFYQWKEGGASTKEVFYSVINDLSNMTNEQEALTLASNTWSSLGEDNAMAVITSLANVSDAYTDVKGSMESLKEVRYDSITNQYKTLGRTFQSDVMQPILTKFLPVAQKGMKLLTDNTETIIPVATAAGAAVGTMWVAKKAKTFIGDVKDTAKGIGKLVTKLAEKTAATTAEAAATTASASATAVDTAAKGAEAAATGTAAVAQGTLNAAMSACPVLLLVTGIGALVGAVALLASKEGEAGSATDELNEKVDRMGESLAASQEQLASAMDTAAESIDHAQSKAAVASSAAEELAKLADQTSLTNEEQSRMVTLAGELNSLYPEMGLKIDSVTGKLNMSSKEILNYVENMKKMALAEAYTRAAADSYDAVVEATTELTKAQETEQEVTDKLTQKKNAMAAIQKAEEKRIKDLKDAEDDYQEALLSGADNTSDYIEKMSELENQTYEVNGQVMSYSDAMTTLNDEISSLTDAQEKATEEVGKQKAAVEEATLTADGYIEKSSEMNQADAERTEALKGVNDAYTTTSEAAITTAGQELEAYKSLSEEQQELAVNITNSVLTMQENVQGALESQMNMFEAFDGGVKLSTDELLSNMQSQITGVQEWEQNLALLADKGINQDLLQNLAEMGPQGAGYVKTFVEMSDEEFAQANDLWSQSVDIKSMSDQWGQELTQSVGELSAGGAEAWSGLAENMGMAANDSGEYVVQGMVNGMKEAADQLTSAGEEAGNSLLKSIDTSLGVASPSKKTRQSGVYTISGLVQGMKQTSGVAQTTIKTIGSEIIINIQKILNVAAIRPYGYNVSVGLAEGIRSGRSQVISAATEVAGAAIRAATNKLEIHSPSRVFRRLGIYSVDGGIEGAKEEIPRLERTYQEVAQAAIEAYETRMQDGIRWTGMGQYTGYESFWNDTITHKENTNVGGYKEVAETLEQLKDILKNLGITQNITINGSKSTAAENARAFRKVGRELAFGR